MTFRFLNRADVSAYKELRLLSLRESPFAFSDSYEDELNKSVFDYQLEIQISGSPAESFVLGAFSGSNELAGFVKFKKDKRSKARHKGSLHALYIRPEMRGNGLGEKLLHKLFSVTGQIEGLEQIHLWALVAGSSVTGFYEKAGFRQQGAIVKNDLKINDTYVDAVYMVKYF
ncbi:MAG: hypothetical protein JWO44_1101 [Bacteroidetes bacterium]|nr:hypothetical protein [Bacteroidota bacterium]